MRLPTVTGLILFASIVNSNQNYDKLKEPRLINNTFLNIKLHTTLRYFHSDLYYPSQDEEEIWFNMGQDIQCTVNNDLSVDLILPEIFDFVKPFKVYSHDFAENMSKGKTEYVNAWMESEDKDVNIILVDWADLSHAGEIVFWESLEYYDSAMNAIDIGEYLGRCFAAITEIPESPVTSYHLVGQGLAAHMMAKAARIYHEITDRWISRVTGLDPAGIFFIDGPIIPADAQLHVNRLSKDVADFVDVIHSDGSLKPTILHIPPLTGDLSHLGHFDYYPAGGSQQPGCEIGGPDYLQDLLCSNSRASYYFLHSILKQELFPSKECQTVTACNNGEVVSHEVMSFMGSKSQDSFAGSQKLFFLDIKDHHWNFYEHTPSLN